MKLTRNFKLEEFLYSGYATMHGIDNTPPDIELVTANLLALCENVLQGIRDGIGKPIIISSGYRSPALNAAIGGSKNSQHSEGEAADLVVPGMTNEELFAWISISPLPYDQLIVEKRGQSEWVHVSYDKDKIVQRREKLRSPDGKTFMLAAVL